LLLSVNAIIFSLDQVGSAAIDPARHSRNQRRIKMERRLSHHDLPRRQFDLSSRGQLAPLCAL
jgi:hypothetical protein